MLKNAEPIERAIADDEAASALVSPRDVRSRRSSAEDVGDETGISAGRFDLRGRDITKVDDEINLIIGLASRLIKNVTTAPGAKLWLDLARAPILLAFRGNVR